MKANTNYFYTSVIKDMEEIMTDRKKKAINQKREFSPALKVMEGSKSMIKNV